LECSICEEWLRQPSRNLAKPTPIVSLIDRLSAEPAPCAWRGASETLEDAAESGFGFLPDAAGGLGDLHALLRSLAASCIQRTRYSIDGTPTRSLNPLGEDENRWGGKGSDFRDVIAQRTRTAQVEVAAEGLAGKWGRSGIRHQDRPPSPADFRGAPCRFRPTPDVPARLHRTCPTAPTRRKRFARP
jgi:hypothetical protein